jgi:hypothetical protein
MIKKNFMKNLFFTLCMICSVGHVSAQQNTSSIYVYNSQGDPFYLLINGVQQNYMAQNIVQLSGLTAYEYQVQVVFKDRNLGALPVQKLQTVDAAYQYGQSIYRINIDPMGFYVMQLEHFFPGFVLMPTNRNQQIIPYHTVVQNQVPVYQQPPVLIDFHAFCTSTQHVCGMPNTPAPTPTPIPAPSPVPVAPPSPMPGYNGPVGCSAWPMSEEDFNRAMSSVQSKSFDNTKLVVAKQIASANCLKVSQVKRMTKLFSFDNGKLDFAKYAYDHTYDIGNYYQVNDVFDFDNSAKELSNYITSRK